MPDEPTTPLPAPVRRSRFLPVPVADAWELLADGRHHDRLIPLTVVTGDEPGLGGQIRAVSGPGASRGWGLVDTMRIDAWDPPTDGSGGRASFTKLGPILLGTADIEVVPAATIDGQERCRATWTEQVWLAGPLPPAVTGPLLRPALDAMLRFALARAETWLVGHRGLPRGR
ncbi:SRPBCC family protein [Cellulomonas marina]|uniref:Polyketide cyclase / dehydrase and lipid transport n=1 Tax=Cellulomonas marina TaxID=988821 RepID=A0A1I1AP81_9CELL|nr:SRPBCC family protein [Cellulomonas marina]GIG30435.1 hypothetical protein Cma02nite_30350 [Cellulomonas marina]SFB39216.1 Polyketide cyclase / dehydrase and lipid transport [Cellulomonas marina]